MVIFQICKSIVLISVTSVLSSVKLSEFGEPIHPHLFISGSGPVVAFPGKASSMFSATATILVCKPLKSIPPRSPEPE